MLDANTIISVREEEHAGGERYLVAGSIDVDRGEETREAKVKLYGGSAPPGAIGRLADFLATGEYVPPVEPTKGGVPKVAAAATAGCW